MFKVYQDYQRHIEVFLNKMKTQKVDTFDSWQQRRIMIDQFKRQCEEICTNESELCDIVIDICYKAEKTKQFAWDVCGDTILSNLLRNNNDTIHYPELVMSDGEFEYCGEQFVMCEKVIGGENDDCFE